MVLILEKYFLSCFFSIPEALEFSATLTKYNLKKTVIIFITLFSFHSCISNKFLLSLIFLYNWTFSHIHITVKQHSHNISGYLLIILQPP